VDRVEGAGLRACEPDEASGAVATTRVVDSTTPPPRPPTRVIREPADEAARQLVAFMAERRLI